LEFINLHEEFNHLQTQLDSRIRDVLHHDRSIMRPGVKELEPRLAHYPGVRHCITYISGTGALLMPLMAWGSGPGDAVFTTPFTFSATAEVVTLLGALPVFIDIDPQTYNMHPPALEEAIRRVNGDGKRCSRAIIPVDLFSLPAEYDQIGPLAKKNGLLVLGDSAQAFGGSIKGQRACSFGDASATSSIPAKPLGCYGEGGAIFTKYDELAGRRASIRVHSKGTVKYNNVHVGLNGRLDTIQAAILLENRTFLMTISSGGGRWQPAIRGCWSTK